MSIYSVRSTRLVLVGAALTAPFPVAEFFFPLENGVEAAVFAGAGEPGTELERLMSSKGWIGVPLEFKLGLGPACTAPFEFEADSAPIDEDADEEEGTAATAAVVAGSASAQTIVVPFRNIAGRRS